MKLIKILQCKPMWAILHVIIKIATYSLLLIIYIFLYSLKYPYKGGVIIFIL